MARTPIGATRFKLGEHPRVEEMNLDDLGDVYAPEPDPHDIIYWDATSGYWRTGSIIDATEAFDMVAAGGAPWVVPGQIAYTYGVDADAANLNMPLHCKTGNLLLCIDHTEAWTEAAHPTGFTYLSDMTTSGGGNYGVHYRVVDGTEGATVAANWNWETGYHRVTILEIQDAKDPVSYPPTITQQIYQVPAANTGGPLTVAEVTPEYGNCWLYLACYALRSDSNLVSWDYSYQHLVEEHDFAVGTQVILGKRSIVDHMQASDLYFSPVGVFICVLGQIAVPGTLAGAVEDNSIFAYDAPSETWIPQMWYDLELAHKDHVHFGDGGSVLMELGDLSDVDINTPADLEVLAYDDDTDDWINMTAAEAGLSDTGHDHDLVYSGVGHDHDADYSAVDHNHDLDYAAIAHDHDADYSDIAHSHDLDDLADVDAAAPNDGDVLTYDTVSGDWVPEAPAGGSNALDDLTDVDAAAPTDQDVLTWDDDTDTWIPQAPPAAGAHGLDDHTDVALVAPAAWDILMFDGDDWVDYPLVGSIALDGLYDVTIAAAAEDEVLAYDFTSNEWINQTAAEAGLATDDHDHDAAYMAIGAALADLSDVDATAPDADDVLTWDGDSWGPAAPTGGGGGAVTTTRIISYTIPGILATGTGYAKLMLPYACTIVSCRVLVGTAPVGASAIFDVHKDGTTIYTTQGNRPTITTGNTDSGSWVAPDVTAFAANSYFTVDVDQVGSTTAGANAVLSIQITVEEA